MKSVFVICLLCLFSSCYSQLSIIKEENSFYQKGIKYYSLKLRLINNENKDIILWFDKYNSKKSKKCYFIDKKGDYKLMDLIYEGIMPSNQQLFCNFLKVVKPNEEFSIYINSTTDKLNFVNDYLKVEVLDDLIDDFNFRKEYIKSYESTFIVLKEEWLKVDE